MDPSDRTRLPFPWPNPPFQVVLVEPEIPPNTGNIARLCAATGSRLHLVRPLGFTLSDRAVKRAGLDYWDSVRLDVHDSFSAFQAACPQTRTLYFSTRGRRSLFEAHFRAGDALVFGSETRGLPAELIDSVPDRVFAIPMLPGAVRSLNLANAASVVLYEALRQVSGSP